MGAQGNENALGFSLTFDTNILSITSPANVQLGVCAAGAVLNVNTNQTPTGRLGIALALSAGSTFPSGSCQVVTVTFSVAGGTGATSTTIAFGDQPILREIVDANVDPLPATYVAGSVSICGAYEADVAPRPNGSGTVSIADWVQVGRFAAVLDMTSNACEFARADCAPKPCGNGSITISDWVQAGRYAAVLDPLIATCGATAPASAPSASHAVTTSAGAEATSETNRIVRAVDMTIGRGHTNSLFIVMDAQGDENALGFSLDYDTNLLSFIRASVGADAANAVLNVNTNQTESGHLGIALSLSAGQVFTAGPRSIVSVSFTAAPDSATNTIATQITFSDQPIGRETVDALANPLSAVYSNAVVTVTRPVFPPGDVNADSHVTGADSLLLNQVIVGLRSMTSSVFATAGFSNGDVNTNNVVTGGDSLLINQVIVGLRSYITTKILPNSRTNNVPTAVTIYGIGFPTNSVPTVSIGAPVSLTLTNVAVVNREQITALVPAGGGLGTGTVNVIYASTNGVISFGRFINQ